MDQDPFLRGRPDSADTGAVGKAFSLRLFVGITPPDPVLHSLAAIPLSSPGRRADPVHLTVAFLGSTNPMKLADIESALSAAAKNCGPVSVRLSGGGKFGSRARSVFWVGVHGITRTAETIRKALRAADVLFDDRPFQPHITVLRTSRGVTSAQVQRDVEELRRYQGPGWTIEEIGLFRSHLGEVARHELLTSFALCKLQEDDGP